ncbi:chemotaxis protein CheR [Clostridium tetani]|uniref:CheR family methyltransferase n=1 Tax=Clostridium tetani TaxID=1513 RepID=UPI00100A6F75|nr:protein-glutamate O-methyltransferase CheR [Clostridium tetani]RXI46099.1 chemotaxis protein CheR [Clostridium tetani]RXM61491.1 chemotaxis protein CheR [Clostridium tetani]RXM70087.1 chemotaxis protein CheR [Clostridium tetani]
MDLEKFKDWVYKEFRINLHAYKPNQLHRRLLSLMSRVGARSVDEYIDILKKDREQRQKFLDFITINVTEFFRNLEMFEDLKSKIKAQLLSENKNLKVWSAACSIGAEPYSLGILLNELAPLGRHTIIATDLDEKILERAKLGFYTENDIKNVNKDRLDKYFKKHGEFYFIDDKIKRMVNFRRHDLILDNYEKNFDLIVCRNVVIYFNQDIKDKIYEKFNESLKKGGLLFVGATESIYNYKNFNFDKASTFIYKKA